MCDVVKTPTTEFPGMVFIARLMAGFFLASARDGVFRGGVGEQKGGHKKGFIYWSRELADYKPPTMTGPPVIINSWPTYFKVLR